MPKDSRPLFKTHRIGGQKGPPIQKGQQLFTKNILNYLVRTLARGEELNFPYPTFDPYNLVLVVFWQ